MRLSILDRPHGMWQRAKLAIIRRVAGGTAPDPVKVILFRYDWFGAHLVRLLQAVLRGDSDWSAGERELLAAFTSKLRKCEY